MKRKLPLRIIIASTLLILVMALLSFLNGFRWLNTTVFDHLLRYPLVQDVQPVTVTILNNTEHSLSQQQLKPLLHKLEQVKVKQTILLAKYQSDELEQLVEAFPQASIIYSGNSSEGAVSVEFAALQGTYREFKFNNAPIQPRDGSYLFNFWIKPNLLPSISLEQANNGAIISNLFADKIAVIQIDDASPFERLHIPETLNPPYLNSAQMVALALETANSKTAPYTTSLTVAVVLMILFYSFHFVCLQLISARGLLLFEFVIATLIYGVTLFAYFWTHLLFPVVELYLLQIIGLVGFLMIERKRETSIVLNRAAKISGRLNQKLQPPSFMQNEAPWRQMHNLINQHLQTTRSIFLAKVPNDHRIEAIDSLNCTLDDIKERRRDFERRPYSDAITLQRPYRLTDKVYFTDLEQDEIEYLVPLIFAGEVIGIWALTLRPTPEWQAATFEAHLYSFAKELSELMFHREQYQRSRQREQRMLQQLFSMQYAIKEHESLDAVVEMLERRYDLLQDVFSGMSSASVLYNLFGQILLSNQTMEQLGHELNIKLYNLSAHDLLVLLTEESSELVKQQLLQVTLHGESIDLQLSYQNMQLDYVLRVRPIQIAEEQQQASSFMTLGILFEFVDVSSVRQVIMRKRDLYRQYFHQLRNNFSTMNLYCRRIIKNTAPEDRIFAEKLLNTLEKTSQLNLIVEKNLESQDAYKSELLPINPVKKLERCIRDIQEAKPERQIKVELTKPNIMSLALVAHDNLRHIFQQTLELLVADTGHTDATINITIQDEVSDNNQRMIRIVFTSHGYGLPQEHLQSLKQQDDVALSTSDDPLSKLIKSINQVGIWGGGLQIDSELGKGFMVTLIMPAFDTSLNSVTEK